MNDNGAIVFGITPNLMFAVANVIIGLIENGVTKFKTVYIVTDEIDQLDTYEKNTIREIACRGGVKLEFQSISNFIPNHNFEEIGLKKFISKYSIFPLIKLFLPILLNRSSTNNSLSQYDYVLWLDCDVCITGNIDSILNYGAVCACSGAKIENVLKNYQKYDYLKKGSIKPNGGVVLYKAQAFKNVKLTDYFDDIWELLKDVSVDGNHLVEELVLTLALAKHGIDIDILGAEYNYLANKIYNAYPKIVHSVGKAKFWNNPITSLAFPQWRKYNIKWLSELLYQGVKSCDLYKYDHSLINGDGYWELVEANYWKEFWKSFLMDLKFTNENAWVDPDISSSHLKIYSKSIERSHLFFEISFDALSNKFIISAYINKIVFEPIKQWVNEISQLGNNDFTMPKDDTSSSYLCYKLNHNSNIYQLSRHLNYIIDKLHTVLSGK